MARRGALTLMAVLFAAAGCAAGPAEPGPSPTGEPSPQTPSASPSPSVTPQVQRGEIDVAASGEISMPDILPAGSHEFEVSAAEPAELTILEPADGYLPADLATDVGPQTSEAALAAAAARLESQVRSLGGTWVEPGAPASFAVILPAGTYWFVDLGKEPGEAGDDDVLDPANVRVVTVDGDSAGAVLPEPDGEAAASDDRSWTLPESLPARGSLLIRNDTGMTHQLVLDAVPAGSTVQERLQAVRTGHRDCTCGSPARLGPRGEFVWHYDLPPGDYVVLDHSMSEAGYPQYNGAGATSIRLT